LRHEREIDGSKKYADLVKKAGDTILKTNDIPIRSEQNKEQKEE